MDTITLFLLGLCIGLAFGYLAGNADRKNERIIETEEERMEWLKGWLRENRSPQKETI